MSGAIWQESIKTEKGNYKVEKWTYKTVKKNRIRLSMLTQNEGWETLEERNLSNSYDSDSFHDTAEKKDYMAWAYSMLRKFYDESEITEASYKPPIKAVTDLEELEEELEDVSVKGFTLGDTFHAWRWNREGTEIEVLATPAHTDPYELPVQVTKPSTGENYVTDIKRIRGELTAEKYKRAIRDAIKKAEEQGVIEEH